MKVTLIKQFKNHPRGTELDVSKRVFNHLRELDCVPDPRPIKFTDDVIEAAAELDPKRKSRKEPKKK